MANPGDDMDALNEGAAREVGREPRRGGGALALRPVPADALILIPLRKSVLFPGVITPITIGRAASVAAAREAARGDKKVGFLLQREAQKNHVAPDDLHWVGFDMVLERGNWKLRWFIGNG